MELVGTAAGETAEPEKVMPRAINSVVLRIAVFYVGSVLLLSLLLPYTAYRSGTSPFVTFFAAIGVPGAGTIMNLVVLTAALSSLNAGLYSTGRILRSMAMNGSAPRFTGRMSAGGVPYGGIALTAGITLLGVVLNAVVPEQAFEIVLNVAALGILASWGTIVACQLRLVAWSASGVVRRPAFRLPGSPWTGYLTLLFLLGVLVLMAFDYPVGTFTIASLVVIVPALVVGWFAVRKRVEDAAAERMGYTGDYPVR
jgi:L-asparagine permease